MLPSAVAVGMTRIWLSCSGGAHPAMAALCLTVAVTQQHFHSPLPRKPLSWAAPLALTLLPLCCAVPCHAWAGGIAGDQ